MISSIKCSLVKAAKKTLPLIVLLFLSVTLLCTLPPDTSADNMLPINIEADRMNSDQLKNRVTFSGNVKAIQGDMVITAEKMVVNYASEAGAAGNLAAGNVDRIHATGKVTISKKDWTARADSLDYYASEEKAHLLGHAEASQGQNRVSGESIILFFRKGKSVVEGNSQGDGRVKAIIYPKSVQE